MAAIDPIKRRDLARRFVVILEKKDSHE